MMKLGQLALDTAGLATPGVVEQEEPKSLPLEFADALDEAAFLLARLGELDDAKDAKYVREFEGHVRPSMSRLQRALDTLKGAA